MTWPYRDSQVRAAAPILTRDLEALLSLIASAPRDSQELTGPVVLVRWGSIRMFTVLLIAFCACQQTTRCLNDQLFAATVLQTHTHPALALQSQNALATPGIRGLMEAHARRATKANTRMRQDPAAATAALHTPARHLEAS